MTPCSPPSFGHRRYVVVSRYAYAAAYFGQPTTLENALREAAEVKAETMHGFSRRVGVFELRLVKP